MAVRHDAAGAALTNPLSPVVAGCWRMAEWNWSVAERVRWIEAALELGVHSFDHADIYGDYRVEALFGEALKATPGLRQRLRLVTKCGIKLPSAQRPEHRAHCYDTRAAHVRRSVDNALRAFGTDHLDLLLIHRPDPLMQPEELADTFAQLKREGKLLNVGVSNHPVAAFARLQRLHPLLTNQIEFSPLHMGALADGTLDQCADLGLRPMLWSPLARGRLFDGQDEQARRVRTVLEDLGRAHGCSAATMAYAWLMRHPSRPIPVAGSRRVEALREAWAAQALRLEPEDWARVWEASMGHGLP